MGVESLRKLGLPVAIFGGTHLRYFTGIGGLGGILLVAPQGEWLIASDTDLALTAGVENVVRPRARGTEELLRILRKEGIRRLGVDFNQLTYPLYRKIAARTRLVDISGRLAAMRAVKSGPEIRRMREACRMADDAMAVAAGAIRPGATERRIRTAALSVLDGCEAQAFDFIVASGKNSLYTHCFPTGKKIQKNDLVIIDLGVRVDGYCSDLTRTFCLEPGREQRRLHEAVVQAQKVALSAIRPGARCSTVCEKVGRFFGRPLGRHWKYGLGHGIGLDVHESPSLRRGSRDILRKGMTFTVEPGLHVPGLGGARIEDTVLLGKGPERLTKAGYGLVP